MLTLTHPGQKHRPITVNSVHSERALTLDTSTNIKQTNKRFKFLDWLLQVGFGSSKETCLRMEKGQ